MRETTRLAHLTKMSAGCFSWCPFLRKGEGKKSAPNIDSPIAKEGRPIPQDQHPIPKNEHHIPEVKVAAPGKAQYIQATAKEVLGVLQSASGLIPVPLLQDSIGLALKIIQLCEEVSAVEQKVKGLQERVGHLMVVIVDNVTAKSEVGNKESVVEAAKGIEVDVEGLFSTLGTISTDLGEISAKKRWEVVFYKTANEETLDDCMNRLSTALERFKLANDLREYDIIREVRERLERMANTVDAIAVDVKVVSHKVDNLTENIQDVLKRSLAQTPAKEAAREEIPLKPEVFYGRDNLVNDIAQLLVKEETSRVCILGPGGMGKTSVSLAVTESPLVRKHFTRSPVWMPCIGATSKDLFLETLYLQLQVPGDKNVTLDKIISQLNASTDPRLIILDNFETPMLASGKTQKDVEDVLRKLAELKHVALLVTMRGSRPPCDIAIPWQTRIIQPTDQQACLDIFHTICPSSQNDPELPQLLNTLGYMPFAVSLMANLARDTGSTAKDLLSSWAESGPDMLPDDHDTSMNRSIKLSIDSDLVQGNANAVLLLSILSLLPAGTTKQNLEWWAPNLKKSMIPSAISTLMRAGLLVENRRQDSEAPKLFVIPVVQSFMQHERVGEEIRHQILQSCCHFVLGHASRWLDSAFPVNSKVLAGEDINLQSILIDLTMTQHTQLSDQYMDVLIAFCWHRCDTKPNADIVEYALTAARSYRKDSYLALTMWCMGVTHANLGSMELSYKYLDEAYLLFETLPPEDLVLRRLGAQCGFDLIDNWRSVSNDRRQMLQLALNIESKCATHWQSDPIHGRSLVYVGMLLEESGNVQDALVYLERAKVILTVVGGTGYLAEAYLCIGSLYRHQDQFTEAITALQYSWDLTERSGNLRLEAIIAAEAGENLISANRITEGWNYLETALMKATSIGARAEIAWALACMGYAYLCQKDYENAYGAFEAVRGNLEEKSDWQALCTINMEAIRQKQGNPQMAIQFCRPFPIGGSSSFNPDDLDFSN